MFMTKASIAIYATSPELNQTAEALAQKLQLRCIPQETHDYDYLLLLTPHFLGLQKTNSKAKPLTIDFLSPKMQYRRKQASLRKELLARALGLKNKTPRHIVDATAGLGRDSFILASLGFEVHILERSPIIFALLEDAIKRASHDTETGAIVKRMHLMNVDAVTYLKTLIPNPSPRAQNTPGEGRPPCPDIIYLDPMFPESKKTALSKQDMRIFHDVVGEDCDGDQLLKAALTCATQRVVVKRPRLAAPLAGLKPSFSMEGSSNRFDIYLTQETYGNTSSVT